MTKDRPKLELSGWVRVSIESIGRLNPDWNIFLLIRKGQPIDIILRVFSEMINNLARASLVLLFS